MNLVKKKLHNQGFTMVELIVVLLVIALLLIFSPIVVPQYFQKARDAERKSDFDRIGKALEEHFARVGCYPSKLPECGEEFWAGSTKLLDKTYCDPKLNESYIYIVDGTTCDNSYELYTSLERDDDPSIVRIRCDEGCGPECIYNYGISSTNRPLDTCKPPPKLYACGPSRNCLEFADPQLSECPIIFPDDPTCQGVCDIKENRCHDERGKKIPG